MSIIFNNFPSCIIYLTKQKWTGKGLYCKYLLKFIYLYVYTSEIFYEERVLSKTSTLWLCSGVRFAWRTQVAITNHLRFLQRKARSQALQKLLQVPKGLNSRSMVAPIVQLVFPRPIFWNIEIAFFKIILETYKARMYLTRSPTTQTKPLIIHTLLIFWGQKTM